MNLVQRFHENCASGWSKKVLFTLAVGSSLLLFTGCGGDDAPVEGESGFVENSSVFANTVASLEIEGMHCEMACGGKIEESLNSMSGVASCDIDFDNKMATVKFDNKVVTKDEMVDIIQNLNSGQFKVVATDLKSVDGNDEVMGSSSESSASGDVNASTGGFQVPNFLDALREML